MKSYISKNKTNLLTYGTVIAAFIIMQTLSSLDLLSFSLKGYLVPICVYIVLTVSLNLVVGISGELSLGHAGFMGVGAFAGVVISSVLAGSVQSPALRLLIAMVTGGIIAGIAGVIIGIPVLRLRGDYLAIVTLAFGEILKNLAGNLYIGRDSKGLHFAFSANGFQLEETGEMILKGPMGASGIDRIATFPMGFLLILFTLFVVLNLINSKEGRAIKAIRDNRIAAESVGINVTAFRMKAFVVSAFLAGMAGALYGLNYYSMTASKFNFNTSINILVFVVLGGMGNIFGSVIAATLLYLLPEMMRELEDFRMILYAVVLIVVMLCTWSPKVKGALEVFKANVKEKLSAAVKKDKKKAGGNE
jgi:branched-chain amino acid transport system permease protein